MVSRPTNVIVFSVLEQSYLLYNQVWINIPDVPREGRYFRVGVILVFAV